MAANIDMSNGRANIMVAGAPPWHRAGVNVEVAQNSENALEMAGLNFEVKKYHVLGYDNDNPTTSVNGEDWRMTVRTDTNAALGMVSSDYEPLQNKEAFDFLDSASMSRSGRSRRATTQGCSSRRSWFI